MEKHVTDSSHYSKGGPVSGSALVHLADDEHIWDRDFKCTRQDDAHLYESVDIAVLGDVGPVFTRGRCPHRACHVVPVESTVDGAVIARLCTACDSQLRP